mgnify:CR=1 FL=1
MTMTAKDMVHAMNSEALYITGGLSVDVRIVDVKQTYGSIRYQIVPVKGMGERWVEGSSLLFKADEDVKIGGTD